MKVSERIAAAGCGDLLIPAARHWSARSRRRPVATAVDLIAARPPASTARDSAVVGPGGAPSTRSFQDRAHTGATSLPNPGIVSARASTETRAGDPEMAAWWSGDANAANRPGPASRKWR